MCSSDLFDGIAQRFDQFFQFAIQFFAHVILFVGGHAGIDVLRPGGNDGLRHGGHHLLRDLRRVGFLLNLHQLLGQFFPGFVGFGIFGLRGQREGANGQCGSSQDFLGNGFHDGFRIYSEVGEG